MSEILGPWYIHTAAGAQGPYATEDMIAMRGDNTLLDDHYVWREGMAEWLPAGRVKELSLAVSPPPPSQALASAPSQVVAAEPVAARAPRRSPRAALWLIGLLLLLGGGGGSAYFFLAPSLFGAATAPQLSTAKPADVRPAKAPAVQQDTVPAVVPPDLDTTFYAQPRMEGKTDRVFILVIDGARYSETFGDKTRKNTPHIVRDLASQGVTFTDFRNMGVTSTNPGHTAMTTGFYENMVNDGTDWPDHVPMFQIWRAVTGADTTEAWVIMAKHKLAILQNTSDSVWHDRYMPSQNCGVGGLGIKAGAYRTDTETWDAVRTILPQYHPRLAIINLKEPDASGHANDWKGYIRGIQTADSIAWQLWRYLQSDSFYAGRTALFIVNDHGRHLDGVKDGFINHGCDCDGCRHIMLLALGPDFQPGTVVNTAYQLIDLPVTIGHILGFKIPFSQGKVMSELFGRPATPEVTTSLRH